MEGVFLGSRWQNLDGYRLGALAANHDGSPQLLVHHDVPNDGQIWGSGGTGAAAPACRSHSHTPARVRAHGARYGRMLQDRLDQPWRHGIDLTGVALGQPLGMLGAPCPLQAGEVIAQHAPRMEGATFA